MRTLLAVLLIGCRSQTSEPPGHAETDPVQRAVAMAEATPTGTPRWRSGTRWLGGDRPYTHAIDHGSDLIAVSGDELLLVPKDGSPAVRIVAFQDRGVSRLVALNDELVAVQLYRRDVTGAEDTLVVVRLDGKATDELAGVPSGTLLSGRAGRLYWAYWTKETGGQLWTSPMPYAKPVMAARAERMVEDLVATDTGVVWREWDGVMGEKARERIVTLAAGAHAPTAAEHVGPLSYVTGNGSRLVAYDAADQIVALEPTTAAVTPISRPLVNLWELRLGPTAACIVDNGPQIEFHKRSKLLAVPVDGSGATELASDLDHAHVHTVSASHCYATYAGRGGIAEIPLR